MKAELAWRCAGVPPPGGYSTTKAWMLFPGMFGIARSNAGLELLLDFCASATPGTNRSVPNRAAMRCMDTSPETGQLSHAFTHPHIGTTGKWQRIYDARST